MLPQVEQHCEVADGHLDHILWPERARAVQFVRLVCEMLKTRMWCGFYHAWTFPDVFASGLHEDDDTAKDGMFRAKKIWEIIQRAEVILHEEDDTRRKNAVGLRKLLDDMGFHKHQINREMIAQAISTGWDHTDTDFQCMLHECFAVPGNTKTQLEDLRACLQARLLSPAQCHLCPAPPPPTRAHSQSF